jgi:1-acyl-sn-glycerol-3-phosphate acyltransferase
LISAAFKRRWRGLERLPRTGAAIVAMNHISYADPFVIARAVWDRGRLPRFLAKAGLFRIPVVGRIVSGAGQIPVYRGTADAGHALRGAVDALERGEMVLIYPEGTVTRDPDFWPMQAKTGIARLALLAPGVPVIPVGQWGAQRFLDFYAKKFRPLPRKTVWVSVGEPVDLTRFAGAEPTGPVLREMTDLIMVAVRDQVAELRGQTPPEQFFSRPPEDATGVASAPPRDTHHDNDDRESA